MIKRPLLFTLLWAVVPLFALAQDPFFTHFYGNESLFNPALVGSKGALTVNLKAKQQWHSADAKGYRTLLAGLEETLPCSFFDYGLAVLQDVEGEGLLRTQQFGGMLAAPLPVATGSTIFQVNIGIGLAWAQQRIDFSRLLFIDQLDPKYGLNGPDGLPIPTAFSPDNDGRSNWYFKPSGGVAFKLVLRADEKKAIQVNGGAAIHNKLPFGSAAQSGHTWSLLGLDSDVATLYSFFLNGEAVVGYLDNSYFSVRPQLFLQTQAGLTYWEMGSIFSFSRQFSTGLFYHSSQPEGGQASTNWGSIQLEMGFFPSVASRVDLGFAYNFNVTGLRNYVANAYELSLRFSFAKSPMCSLAGDPAPYDRKRALPCPTLRSSQRSKIYENIWYNHH